MIDTAFGAVSDSTPREAVQQILSRVEHLLRKCETWAVLQLRAAPGGGGRLWDTPPTHCPDLSLSSTPFLGLQMSDQEGGGAVPCFVIFHLFLGLACMASMNSYVLRHARTSSLK